MIIIELTGDHDMVAKIFQIPLIVKLIHASPERFLATLSGQK
jgi:hypothetical protein